MDIFQSTRNTRPVLEHSIKYIRSDVPTSISECEISWMLSNHVTTIVDLRTDEERASKQCPLMNDVRFQYRIYAIRGGDRVPHHENDVADSYSGMVDASFDELIAFLLTIQSGVLFFCNAGKDRTGVVAAALLYKLGMCHDYIVDDYMKSKVNLEPVLHEYAKQNPAIDIHVITPQKRYIEGFLNWYREREKQKSQASK